MQRSEANAYRRDRTWGSLGPDMLKKLPLILALVLLQAPGLAQAAGRKAAAPPPPVPVYGVAVETLEITGAKAGFMEMGAAAGGTSLLYRTTISSSSVLTKTRSKLTNSFRFLGAGEAPLQAGKCTIKTDGRSMFGVEWNQLTTQLYACEIKDRPADTYAMEVALPAFKQTGLSLGGMSISTSGDSNDPAIQAILRGRMTYGGAKYEAVPTGFDQITPISGRRVVQGYVIIRNGTAVGRIVFQGASTTKGSLTLPVSATDGREAVIFMALNLLVMPDLYSPAVRETM